MLNRTLHQKKQRWFNQKKKNSDGATPRFAIHRRHHQQQQSSTGTAHPVGDRSDAHEAGGNDRPVSTVALGQKRVDDAEH